MALSPHRMNRPAAPGRPGSFEGCPDPRRSSGAPTMRGRHCWLIRLHATPNSLQQMLGELSAHQEINAVFIVSTKKASFKRTWCKMVYQLSISAGYLRDRHFHLNLAFFQSVWNTIYVENLCECVCIHTCVCISPPAKKPYLKESLGNNEWTGKINESQEFLEVSWVGHKVRKSSKTSANSAGLYRQCLHSFTAQISQNDPLQEDTRHYSTFDT